jgi:hypothetical protein
MKMPGLLTESLPDAIVVDEMREVAMPPNNWLGVGASPLASGPGGWFGVEPILTEGIGETSPPDSGEFVWPDTSGLFSVEWTDSHDGRAPVSSLEVVGADGCDWMERTYDAVNRVSGVSGLANDSTWELREDGSVVIEVWTGSRRITATVEELGI